MESAIPFIVWIFCVGVAAIIIGKALTYDEVKLPTSIKTEAFADMNSVLNMAACPYGTTSYITDKGNTYCCSGEVIRGQCNGNDVCSLSPKPEKAGVYTCSSWLANEWNSRSNRFCPRSMPNYFGLINRGSGADEGCSASLPIPSGSQPSDTGRPKCKIYSNYNDDVSKQDSCTNVKEMDNLVCPVSNATKSFLTINGPGGKPFPLILKCGYLPPDSKSNGLPIDCMDDASVRRYLSVTREPISEEYLKNSVRFCSSSKAYYIDGTLSAPPALDVPGYTPKTPVCPPAAAGSGGDDTSVCFKNGVKLGQRVPNFGPFNFPWMGLSESECKSMGGTVVGGAGGDPLLCLRPGYSQDDLSAANDNLRKTLGTSPSKELVEKFYPEMLRKLTFNVLCVDASQSQGGAPAAASPRGGDTSVCFKNGVKVGKREPSFARLNIPFIKLSESECKSMGGTFLSIGADLELCLRPGYSKDDFSKSYGNMIKKLEDLMKTGKDRENALEELYPEFLRNLTLNGLCLDA
jgi:hypothetical protein